MKVFGPLELTDIIKNLKIEIHSEDPEFSPENIGSVYFNSNLNTLRLNTGSSWVSIMISNTDESNGLITTLGRTWINEDLSINPSNFNNEFKNVYGLDGNSSLFDVLKLLDSAITSLKDLGLESIPKFSTFNVRPYDLLQFNGDTFSNIKYSDFVNSLELTFQNIADVSTDLQFSSGDILVFGNDKFIPKKIYFEYTNTSLGNTFSVTHNLGKRYVAVTPINLSTNTLYNGIYSINYLNNNSFTITFTESIRPKLLIWSAPI